MMRRHWLFLFALALFATTLPCAAQPNEPGGAQPSEDTPPDEAAEVLRKGKAALIAEDAARARNLFRLGLALETTPTQRWRMMLGLALASELDGGLVESLTSYRAFLRDSADHPESADAKWEERRVKARADVRRLESEVLRSHARLDLQSDPPGATIWIDGTPTSQVTPALVYLKAGTHELQLELGGYTSQTLPVTAKAGERPVITRILDPAPPEVAPPVEPDAPESEIDLLIPAVATLTAGAAMLWAAGAVHRKALSDADEVKSLAPIPANFDRDDALRARIDDYQAAYITTYVVGGVAAATGVTLLLVDLLSEGSTSEMAVRPHGLGVAGTF